MAETLNVGLLGCGRIAQFFHLKILARLPRVRLAALADADEKLLAQAKGRAPGAQTYTDYRALIAESGVDAVVNCLPTGLHGAAGLAAVRAGKHLYQEKPIAIGVAEAAELVAAWEAAGVVGAMGFNFRDHPVYTGAKAYLAEGRIGAVVGVRSVFGSAARPLPAWKASRATGGGVLLDLFSHHGDLARWLFDAEAASVFAHVRSVKTEADTASVNLRLTNGVVFQSFHTMCGVDEDRMEILGEAGALHIDRYAGTLRLTPPVRPSGKAGPAARAAAEGLRRVAAAIRPAGEPSFERALGRFAEAALGGAAPAADLRDGYCCLRLVEAAERSAETGAACAPGG